MNILVVDDDLMVLESCRRILSSEGMTVESVSDVPGALELLSVSDSRFDLMITDVKMPGQDGLSLLTRVRQRHPALCVLLMTGYLVPEIRRQGQLLGAFCLSKPFTPDELIAAVTAAAVTPKEKETPDAGTNAGN